MKHFLLVAPLAIAFGLPASANDYETRMKTYLESEIMGWAQDQVLLDAIRNQNSQTADYTQEEIDALDTAWRAEVALSDRPTIAPVLENAASDFLRERVAAAGGTMTEVFVMDARGLNVAASAVTSDYWQGDEEKFSETFPKGPEAVHFGEVELDESSQTYQGQISIPIVDPVSNAVLGAMTIGINAESLF
jgi:hypothetical protein